MMKYVAALLLTLFFVSHAAADGLSRDDMTKRLTELQTLKGQLETAYSETLIRISEVELLIKKIKVEQGSEDGYPGEAPADK